MLLLSLLTNIPTIAACVTFKLIATEYRTQAAVSPCIAKNISLSLFSRTYVVEFIFSRGSQITEMDSPHNRSGSVLLNLRSPSMLLSLTF